MRIPRDLLAVGIWAVALAVVAGCGGASAGGGGAPPGGIGGDDDAAPTEPSDTDGADDGSGVSDSENYALVPDMDELIERTTDDGRIMRFPADQLILLMAAGTPRTEVEQLATRFGGRIAGQVPEIDFYQLELSTTTQAELDAVIAQAQSASNVVAVDYNLANHYTAQCPAISDNGSLDESMRCGLRDIEYYDGLTQFDACRPYLTLHPVFVAVIDTGLDVAAGEFDFFLTGGRLVNLDGPLDTLTESLGGHGTAVAGLIAAEDNSAGVNGIAERFLSDFLLTTEGDLWLLVGTSWCMADSLGSVARAVEAGADMINLSFESSGASVRPDARMMWHYAMSEYGEVLFVVAAGDDRRRLTGENSAPAGILLPNVITVGGTAECSPMRRAHWSNWGPGVDVYAPSEAVPIVSVATPGGIDEGNGTSYAAPQVTALAAILKSLDPDITPEGIKNQIRDFSFPLDEEESGLRVVLTWPIGNLLLDLDLGSPVEDWLDPRRWGGYGPTEDVMSALCGGFSMIVGDYTPLESVAPFMSGSIEEGWFLIQGDAWPEGYTVDDVYEGVAPRVLVGMEGWYDFHLGSHTFERFPSSTGVEMSMEPDAGWPADEDFDYPQAISGTLTFDSCSIDERHPLTHAPVSLIASGSFEGTLEQEHYDAPPSTWPFSGTFDGLVLSVEGAPGDPLIEHLEANCDGGRP